MSDKYSSAPQQNVVAVVEALAQWPLPGLGKTALAEKVGISQDQAYRTLKNLEIAGWAEPAPTGGWRLTPRLASIADRFRIAIADLHRAYLESDA